MRYCTCFAFGPETVSSSIEEVTLGTNAEVLLLEWNKNKKRMLLGLHWSAGPNEHSDDIWHEKTQRCRGKLSALDSLKTARDLRVKEEEEASTILSFNIIFRVAEKKTTGRELSGPKSGLPWHKVQISPLV